MICPTNKNKATQKNNRDIMMPLLLFPHTCTPVHQNTYGSSHEHGITAGFICFTLFSCNL